MTQRRDDWPERSRAALAGALGDLRERLSAKADGRPTATAAVAEDSAYARLIRKFHLSPFERDVLLLTAGVEVDSSFARLVSDWHGDPARFRPTYAFALAILNQPHWSAISPDAVLRRGRLIRLGEGHGLVDTPLIIEEAVLHALNGLAGLDERLCPFASLVTPGFVSPGQQAAAVKVAEAWCQQDANGPRPKVLLSTPDGNDASQIFAAACRALELTGFEIDVTALPADRGQVEDIVAIWERDAVLHDLALLVDAGTAETSERRRLVTWMLDRLAGFVAIAGDRSPASNRSSIVRIPIGEATVAEQTAVWEAALGPLAATLDGELGRITEQFRLPTHAIFEAASELRAGESQAGTDIGARGWEICRRQARGGLDDLAQRLEPRGTWERLILPAAQVELLRSIARHARHRFEVYQRWGFRAQWSRGLGVTALFHGPSGVGKTYAAEVLANDLSLDLYRIDLSATISKYIGETEKNLRRVFDAAEQSGAILLFDEADALFGKRSEVSDSHDRYANLEVSYLLQRMEAYRGLAILTTNLKSALDLAFLRRIRFVVPFPFPSASERERIWRHIFPAEVPLDPVVDWSKLAALAVTGGNIANIALDAAFRAAHERSTVGMRHLLEAAHAECAKLEKPIADKETRGWL